MSEDAVLFPEAEQRLKWENMLSVRLTERLAKRLPRAAVNFDIEQFSNRLSEYDFSRRVPFDEVMSFLLEATAEGSVPMTDPRYFGLFNPAPSFPAECADRIAAAFNPQLAAWSHAPGPVEIERHVIRAVCERVGFHIGAGGHFTAGGSEANETALLCALARLFPRHGEVGASALGGQGAIYVSRESHLAWFKIAHRLGLGRDAVRLVDTDGSGRMSAGQLQSNISTDRAAGFVPLMIASTAGTTNAGMIDPIEELDQIARVEGLWHHVDAAWGGALIALPSRQHPLTGLSLADSVTIDAHKWFATTMGAGMFLCRGPDILSRVFAVSADYMPSNDVELDPYVTSALWSRRFVGGRLFAALACGGWDGVAKHVQRARRLAGLLRAGLEDEGWGFPCRSELAVVNAVPPRGARSPAEVVEIVQKEGSAWLSLAMVEQQPTVRMCITNGRSNDEDIAMLLTALRKAAGL